MSQNLPQICTASAEVYICGILGQIQYRFAVNFGTLNNLLYHTGYKQDTGTPPGTCSTTLDINRIRGHLQAGYTLSVTITMIVAKDFKE